MNYELIIFDLAGTTVKDTNTVGGCLQLALGEAGVDATLAEVNAVMGIPKPVAIAKILEDHGAQGDINKIFERFQFVMCEVYLNSPDISEIEEATRVMTELKKAGFKLAVDTGFDRKITDIVLSRMPWRHLINDSISSDEVAAGRPSPDMLVALAERANVPLSKVVKVGDTPADIQQGKNAQAGLVVGVTYGTHSREELEGQNADALIDHLNDLLVLVRKE